MGRAVARVDLREPGREQAVAGHGHQDPRLAELEHEQHRRHRDHRPRGQEPRRPVLVDVGEGGRERIGHSHQPAEGDHARQHERRRDVENRADGERADDPARHVASRVHALLGRGRDRIEADVGEEDQRRARPDPMESSGEEGMPVLRLHEEGPDGDEEEEGQDLQHHDHVVEAGRLLHPAHEEPRDRGGDGGGEHVADDGHAEEDGMVQVRLVGDAQLRAQTARAALGRGPGGEQRRAVVGRDPRRDLDAEAEHELPEVGGPGDRHRDVADRVLEDQVPADDPGHQLAERRVAVGVGGAAHRHEAGELRVAQGAEAADDRGEEDGDGHARPGRRLAGAPRGRAAQGREDAGADDGPDPEGDEVDGREGLLEAVLALTPFGEQRVQRLASEERRHEPPRERRRKRREG